MRSRSLSPDPTDLAAAALPAGIIALTVIEAVALALFHRKTGRGIALAVFLPNLLAGDCLLLALAVALARGAWLWIGAALLGSLVCHATDMICRWRA